MVGNDGIPIKREKPQFVIAIDPGQTSAVVVLSVELRPVLLFHEKHVLWKLEDGVPIYRSAHQLIERALDIVRQRTGILITNDLAGVIEDQYVALFKGGKPINPRSNLATALAAGMWIEAWAAATGLSLRRIPPGTWQGSELGGRMKRELVKKVGKAKAAALWPTEKLNEHEVDAALLGRYAAISFAQGRLP
jgi:hypothetical protein